MILVRAAIGGRSPGELLPMSALRAPNIDGAPPPTSALSYTGPLSSGAMRSRPSSPPLIRIQNTAPELKQYKVTPIYGSRPHGKYRLGRHTLRYITHGDEENRGGNEIPTIHFLLSRKNGPYASRSQPSRSLAETARDTIIPRLCLRFLRNPNVSSSGDLDFCAA